MVTSQVSVELARTRLVLFPGPVVARERVGNLVDRFLRRALGLLDAPFVLQYFLCLC